MAPPGQRARRARRGFAERTVVALSEIIAAGSAPPATPRGLLAADARAKVVAVLLILVGISGTRSIAALAAAAILFPALARTGGMDAKRLVRDVWLVVPLFTGAIALPALFAAMTPGPPLVGSGPFAVTRPGALAAVRLVLRAGASVSAALVLARSTEAAALLAALRSAGLPQALALVVGMTYRYVFLLAREVEEMHLGLISRRLTPLRTAAGRAFVTSRIAVLLAKTHRTAEDVHLAMLARGFSGEWRTLERPRIGPRDGALVLAAAAVALSLLGAGRVGLP